MKLTAITKDNDHGTTYAYTFTLDGQEIGGADVIVYGDDDVQLDRIDIDAAHQGKGYGTQAINSLGTTHGTMYCAPDNEDSQRLFDRIGYEMSSDDDRSYIDQGYGVYLI